MRDMTPMVLLGSKTLTQTNMVRNKKKKLIGFVKFYQLFNRISYVNCIWGKCPKILYTKEIDKMAYANSADPDQTAPEGEV